MIKLCFNCLFLLLLNISAFSQMHVQMEITSLPAYHPSGSDIYIAGSFNGWNPQDSSMRFQKNAKGNYAINLTLDPGSYEYKITRGSWDKAECKEDGTHADNRVLNSKTDTSISLSIGNWADRFSNAPPKKTVSSNVHLVDSAFLIPQLSRTRRIWIYLPDDYKQKKYPVFYMQDGQNLFDESTAFAGEWGIDDFLDSNTNKCIVVGIDNGGNKRMTEYNPYDNERFGKAEGGAYADFIVKTLKPFIDKRYNTLAGSKSTFIGGSSMGGLISLYALLKYPQAFAGAIVFSPSFWIARPQVLSDLKKQASSLKSRIYLYAGKEEGESMVSDMQLVAQELKRLSKASIEVSVNPRGKHNEQAWRQEFPKAFRWLLKP